LLDDVEPGDAGFSDRLPGIFQTRGREGLDATGFYVNSDVDDKHGVAGLAMSDSPDSRFCPSGIWRRWATGSNL
jgi:hypothetical protein